MQNYHLKAGPNEGPMLDAYEELKRRVLNIRIASRTITLLKPMVFFFVMHLAKLQ